MLKVVFNQKKLAFHLSMLKVVFKPCQHVPACLTCAAALTGCPQCGTDVEEKIAKAGVALLQKHQLLYLLHSVETPDARVGDGEVVEETATPGLRLLKVDPVIENCWQMISRWLRRMMRMWAGRRKGIGW